METGAIRRTCKACGRGADVPNADLVLRLSPRCGCQYALRLSPEIPEDPAQPCPANAARAFRRAAAPGPLVVVVARYPLATGGPIECPH